MAAGTLEKVDHSAAGSSFGSNSGRARVPARREQGYVINLDKRWIWSVLGFGKTDREDPTSPNALEQKATQRKAMSDRHRSLPGTSLPALPQRKTRRLVSTFNPLRGCNSQQAQYSTTPTPLFEHEDEDDFDAPSALRASNGPLWLSRQPFDLRQ
jgi:hypothetical protein